MRLAGIAVFSVSLASLIARLRSGKAQLLPAFFLPAFCLGLTLITANAFALPPRALDESSPTGVEDEADFQAVPIAGSFAFPWSVAFLPDGGILVSERVGRLQLIVSDTEMQEVRGLPVIFSNKGTGHAGLLDIAVDPYFARTRQIFVSYTNGGPERSTLRVLRATFDVSRAELTESEVIFESSAASKAEIYGGRLAVSLNGYLFLTLGDRWERDRAQDLSDTAGSIIRIRTDGTLPDDNPFVATPGARPEIWSYGHRNPLGLAFDSEGRLWSHENGPQGGDELNLIEPGRNYGWPVISHGVEYDAPPPSERNSPTTIIGTAKEGMEQPVHYWTPAIAPSGLAIEHSDDALIFWIGALRDRALVRLHMREGAITEEQHFFPGELGRIRDVRIAPDGHMYLLSDGPKGLLYRIEPLSEQVARRSNRRPL